jgi:hypothetical protein
VVAVPKVPPHELKKEELRHLKMDINTCSAFLDVSLLQFSMVVGHTQRKLCRVILNAHDALPK